jgi:hypothetical protein
MKVTLPITRKHTGQYIDIEYVFSRYNRYRNLVEGWEVEQKVWANWSWNTYAVWEQTCRDFILEVVLQLRTLPLRQLVWKGNTDQNQIAKIAAERLLANTCTGSKWGVYTRWFVISSEGVTWTQLNCRFCYWGFPSFKTKQKTCSRCIKWLFSTVQWGNNKIDKVISVPSNEFNDHLHWP